MIVQPTQTTPGSQSSLREANRARLVRAVQHHGSLTQVELSRVTGLSPASVSNIVTELTEAGVLDTSPSIRSGRRARLVALSRSAGVLAGIDIGTRSMRVALADASMGVLATEVLPLTDDHRAARGIQHAAMLLRSMMRTAKVSGDDLLAVGVGLPAPVDVATGTVASSTLLRGWDGADVAATMGAVLGVPVAVGNDANLGALAEARCGAAIGRNPVVYVHASYGIGAGIVIGGRVLHGHRGTAGELGHVIVDEGGAVCRCGNRGCLETVAGSAALVRMLSASHGRLTLDEIVEKALAGDAGCRCAIAEAGRHLGAAIGGLCSLVDPEMIVIGGRLADADDMFLTPLRLAVDQHALPSGAGAPAVVPAHFGGESGLRGAIAAAMDLAVQSGVLRATP